MGKIGKYICYSLFAITFSTTGALSANASAASYTISIKNSLTGDSISNHQFEFELYDAESNELVQTKRSHEETITFDPIERNVSDIAFYKIIEKNLGEDGMTYDQQIAYVGLHSNGKVAYQKDNTYKTISKDGQPHPYHATEEELQGEAYAVFDYDTGVLTFFRDEAGKYTNRQYDGNKIYFANFENSAMNFTGDSVFFDNTDLTLSNLVTEIVFKDAIRPEGRLSNWFSNYTNLTKADISKLDTSLVTSFDQFFYSADKLSDIDITTLDFSKSTSFNYTFERTKIQEFDSRNYDFSSLTSTRMGGFFSNNPNLRYVNLSNIYVEGSSGEYGSAVCLESLTVEQTHNLYRAFGGEMGPDKWLNTKNGNIMTLSNIIYPEDGPSTASAGTYIRPMCNVDPVLFENSYVKSATPETPESPETSETPKKPAKPTEQKNPNTATTTPAIYFIIFGALSASVFLIGRKMSKLYK